jgi:hypothetical protein
MRDEIKADEEPAPEALPGGARTEAPHGVQGSGKIRIILGLKSASLSEAVDELVLKALLGTKNSPRSAQIAKDLRRNLGYGAVELRRGLAFIHQRVDKLTEPRASLGISREGLDPGVRLQEKIFVVVLFLKPAHDFGFDIPLWARKKFCSERTSAQLRTATDLDAVHRILLSI